METPLVAYLTFTAILVITPGSTTAVVARNTLHGGRSAGIATATGAALGSASHAALAGLGLSILLNRWPTGLTLLRIAGGAYLAWLGARSLYRVMRQPDSGFAFATTLTETAAVHARVPGLRQGLTVNLLNPAIATFYLVVLPTFIAPGASAWYFPALASIHIAMAFVCHGAWAFALHRVRRFFNQPIARRVLEGATGLALVALAARILLPSNP